MIFFELKDDIYYPNRWYLGDVLGVDNWELSTSVPRCIANLQVELVRDGEEMDFTYTEAYALPVVSDKVKHVLENFEGVDFVPINVINKVCMSNYYLLITKNVVDCVDEEKSNFRKFEVNDPVRPDKAGEYRGFIELRVDAVKANGVDIFRLGKFKVALIVSENVSNSLIAKKVTGLKLSQV